MEDNRYVAAQRFREVVGDDAVVTDQPGVDQLAAVTSPSRKLPAGYVFARTREDVRAVLRIANEENVAIWPVGRGKNFGYGAATPLDKKSFVLHLEKMDRIIEINTELAYAVIEPGVTYQQLSQYLSDHHPDLWLDVTDGPPTGSVIGNALERGLGHTPYGDHFGTLCGLEVVLPDGRVIHTGAGPSESRTFHTHKWGSGPYVEGLFSQSNLGVVTRAGVWLMPKPESFVAFVCELDRVEDFPEYVNAMRELRLHNIVQSSMHIANKMSGIAGLGYPRDLLEDGETFLRDDALVEAGRRYRIPEWTGFGALYGTSAQVKAAKKWMRKKMRRFGRVTFVNDRHVGMVDGLLKLAKGKNGKTTLLQQVAEFIVGRPLKSLQSLPPLFGVLKGKPTDQLLRAAYCHNRRPAPDHDLNPARDNCGEMWFAPAVPMTGDALKEAMDLAQHTYHEFGFDYTVGLIVYSPRTAAAVMSLYYDREDPDQCARALDLQAALRERFAAAGFQEYRMGLQGMPHAMQGRPEYQHFIGALKRSLDPNDILAPGRYGVEPNESMAENLECVEASQY